MQAIHAIEDKAFSKTESALKRTGKGLPVAQVIRLGEVIANGFDYSVSQELFFGMHTADNQTGPITSSGGWP